MALSQLAGLKVEGATYHASFRIIVEREFDYVWVTLRRLGIDRRDLEDVVQQVFISLYRRLDDYDASRPIRPWLFVFVLRAASDWRKQARHRVEVLTPPAPVAADTLAPDDALARNEDHELVVRALEDIEIERRAVFILHELEERGMREIVEMLGIPLFTGYSRLRLAREEFTVAVRRLMAQRGGG
jgi:RNA polymerase sigma-70 factor (ECF subfamily)